MEKSFEILEQGLNVASRRGAFVLKEAQMLQEALDNIRTSMQPESKELTKDSEEDK